MKPRGLLAVGLVALLVGPLPARTITLTADDCDQMAVLSARAPRLGWAVTQAGAGVFYTIPQLQLYPDMALLMRFPLDKLPKGQRITKAELTLTAEYVAGAPQIGVRRLLADWGPGVCQRYRRTFPKKEEWAEAGGRGTPGDRAAKDSGVFRIDKAGDYTVDVTEDVELWYTGATANRGWILAIGNGQGVVYLSSPYAPQLGTGKRWRLRVTFEPQ
jgi:hypothetical protein